MSSSSCVPRRNYHLTWKVLIGGSLTEDLPLCLCKPDFSIDHCFPSEISDSRPEAFLMLLLSNKLLL